jgi:hypothetical protein
MNGTGVKNGFATKANGLPAETNRNKSQFYIRLLDCNSPIRHAQLTWIQDDGRST